MVAEHHLYKLIAEHLQAHPTTIDSPKRLRIVGVVLPDKNLPPPAAPRGRKMGTILPLHSPAVSGGGVSENMFKDMMTEMQGGSSRSQGAIPDPAASGIESMPGKKKKKKNRV